MKKKTQEELRKLSPFLHRLRERGDGMEVPDGYFEQMQAEVLRRIREEDTKTGAATRPPLHVAHRRLGWMAAAAAVALLLIAGWWVFRPESVPAEDYAMAGVEIHQSDAAAYLEAHAEEFDLALLAELAALDAPDGETQPPPADELDEYLEELELEELEELL